MHERETPVAWLILFVFLGFGCHGAWHVVESRKIGRGDGVVNVTDLLSLIAVWGPCTGTCDADLDNSGTVDVADLLTLIGDWGACE